MLAGAFERLLVASSGLGWLALELPAARDAGDGGHLAREVGPIGPFFERCARVTLWSEPRQWRL